jgi:hypothetical protein
MYRGICGSYGGSNTSTSGPPHRETPIFMSPVGHAGDSSVPTLAITYAGHH